MKKTIPVELYIGNEGGKIAEIPETFDIKKFHEEITELIIDNINNKLKSSIEEVMENKLDLENDSGISLGT